MLRVLARPVLTLLLLLLAVFLVWNDLARRSSLQEQERHNQLPESRLLVLRDPSRTLDVAAIADPARRGQFRPATRRNLSPGYTNDALWIAATLGNPGPHPLAQYLEVGPPRLQDIRIYFRAADGRWQEQQAGMSIPVQQRYVVSRQSVFPLQLAPGERREVYVRVFSRNAVMLNLRLWNPLQFHESERHVDLLNGLQFGAILLFALYAFVVHASTREKAFLYFSFTLLSYALYDISILQYGYEYLWPGAPDWNWRSPGIFTALTIFSLGGLIAQLLQTRLLFPRWHLALRASALPALLSVPLMLWLDYPNWVQIANYDALLILVASIGAILYAIRQGYRGAGYLLGAFLLFWFTSMLRVGQILGFFPYNILIEYSQAWSMILGGMLMAVAQADKVRSLREEQVQAQQELFEAHSSARQQAEQAVQERTQELRLAKELAEASSRAKSSFLTQLSHELRTPLHSILGYSGLIHSEAEDATTQRRVEAIQRSGRHLLALIDELLDYARGEAGKLQLEPCATVLRELLESVLEETRGLAQEHGARLEAMLADDLPETVMIDCVRLRQVLINLISNACRHSQGSFIALEVTSTADAAAGHCRLHIGVRDNGIGVPTEDRVRIFNPFEQGGQGGRHKGMGLGLAISRQLVQLMGGQLLYEGGKGGSLFHFCIKVAPADADAAPPQPRGRLARRYAGPVRRLLVVDDMVDNRDLLSDVLSRMGFAATAAAGGAEALARLAQESFDLVLTDQIMPGMNGWELLREARRRGHGQPFVLLTAALPAAPAEWADGPAFADILMKPAEPARLADVLARLLALQWLPVEAAAAAPQARPLPPTDVALAELRAAAEQGLVSDIEDWVERVLAEQPAAADFAQAVREAVRRLDLPGIIRMTRGL